MKKCEQCYLRDAKPCYECTACMGGDDHFKAYKAQKKLMTNADRIRAMSDEELAENMSDWQWWDGGLDPKNWLEWLKQTAE